MEQGLVAEVRGLLDQGLPHERMEAMGLEYRFVSRLLLGAFTNEAEMVQRLKYATHDFIRRQLTWFRKNQHIVWITGGERMVQEAENMITDFLAQLD
jgi:tRNA dimethylallyltransferase